MKGFLNALYQYAQEKRIPSYLETREYRRMACDLEQDWTAFRSTLTAEQDQRLESLLARGEKIECLEEEAVFCCGLSMGVGLGRL